MRLRCRRVVGGRGEGEAVVSKKPLSFLEGVDVKTGVIIDPELEAVGETVSGKVLVFPWCRGSTVGTYAIYGLASNGVAPSAMVCVEADIVSAVGCAMAGIPLVHRVERNPLTVIRSGDYVVVDADRGVVEVMSRRLGKRSRRL
ncbi:MAG TPA: DUF126 domain-containing protein [Candidatus Bathyarchaeota archaeon]|nr:DUF126 domain-containing protein [Candidatus Bathyarchaeota archaeon]